MSDQPIWDTQAREDDYRAAIIPVTPELLLQGFFDFPQGHRIERVRLSDDGRTVQFIVTGPLMPEVVAGEPLSTVVPCYKQKDYELLPGSLRPQRGHPGKEF